MTVKPYLQYAQDVISGKIVAGDLIKKACERFFDFMEVYEFREDKVQKVIDFFSIIRHFTGRHAGKPFKLEPWQQFIIASIYGFYTEDGERLTKSAYIEIARKNGKTAFAAGLGLYHLIADNEMDAEVDLAANSKKQAKVAFKFCSNFASDMDPQKKYLNPFRDKIDFRKNLSVMNVFAADESRLDGFNASMFLLDEYHAAKNSRLKEVLQSSQVMRDNPMGIIITTAGYNKISPCYEHRSVCVEILNKIKEDDSLFIAIFSIDDKDDWKDPDVWIKSNPNLGVTVKKSAIEGEIKKAFNSPSEETGVKTKNLNIWCDAQEVWLPAEDILNVTGKVDFKEFDGMDAYVGVDLSEVNDLTAVSYMIPTETKYYFKTFYYTTERSLKNSPLRDKYREWSRLGLIKVIPGRAIDYRVIIADIKEVGETLNIQWVANDPWNAEQFKILMEEEGFRVEAYGQTIGNFNRPTKEMERLILSSNVVIDDNEINRFCFQNVIMLRDNYGNIKPSKKEAIRKVDGVIAKLEALGYYLSEPRYSTSL